jgi:hypothetical protein
MSSCWALSICRSSTNMRRPVTVLFGWTLHAKVPSFESCIAFRSSLMYIMKRIGDRTDSCRSPLRRKFGDDVSPPILYISLWNWYVLLIACWSPGDTPRSCSLSHGLSLLTLLCALDRSMVAVYKGMLL